MFLSPSNRAKIIEKLFLNKLLNLFCQFGTVFDPFKWKFFFPIIFPSPRIPQKSFNVKKKTSFKHGAYYFKERVTESPPLNLAQKYKLTNTCLSLLALNSSTLPTRKREWASNSRKSICLSSQTKITVNALPHSLDNTSFPKHL